MQSAQKTGLIRIAHVRLRQLRKIAYFWQLPLPNDSHDSHDIANPGAPPRLKFYLIEIKYKIAFLCLAQPPHENKNNRKLPTY